MESSSGVSGATAFSGYCIRGLLAPLLERRMVSLAMFLACRAITVLCPGAADIPVVGVEEDRMDAGGAMSGGVGP